MAEYNYQEDVACIVRTVGERTTDACVSLLQNIFHSSEAVHVVRAEPFELALAESFKLGLELGKPWTLIIDADVLCQAKGILSLLNLAQALPDSTFMFHASVADKFFGGYRRAGNRLYRTKWLVEGLKAIPEPGASLRPECATCQTMLDRGFRNFQSYQIVGLHDYEQSYRDILRKVALFSLKHKDWREKFELRWAGLAADQDFQAALEALTAADRGAGQVKVGPGLIERLPVALVHKWESLEKAPLSGEAYTPERVDALIASEMATQGITPTPNIAPREYPLCAA